MCFASTTTDELREVLSKDKKLTGVLEGKARVELSFNQEGINKMISR